MHTVLTSQPLICTALHGLLHQFNFPPKCQVIRKGMQDALSFHSVKTNQVDVTLDGTRCCRETTHRIWCYSCTFFFFQFLCLYFLGLQIKISQLVLWELKFYGKIHSVCYYLDKRKNEALKCFRIKKWLFRERVLAEMKECSNDEHMVQSCSFVLA